MFQLRTIVLQELRKRLVAFARTGFHLLQNFVYIGKEVAGPMRPSSTHQLSPSTSLICTAGVRADPRFRRPAMDEFRAEFDRHTQLGSSTVNIRPRFDPGLRAE